MTIKFDFLDSDKNYNATIYKYAEDAHWDLNPEAYEKESVVLTNESELTFVLKPGGGFAMSIIQE